MINPIYVVMYAFWKNSPPTTGISPKTGTFGIRKVFVKLICCTPLVWIILAVKIAKAGANMFSAVPLMIWSALSD